MYEYDYDKPAELLPIELWQGKHYREIWEKLRPLTDSEELAWDVFAEIIGQMLLRRNVTGYPLGQQELDDDPDADENIPWPFTEEDERRHRRLLLLQSHHRMQERLERLDGQMELF